MVTDFSDLRKAAAGMKNAVVGVPAAEDEHSIRTVMLCRQEGIADFILCGNREKIVKGIRDNGGDPADYEILKAADNREAAAAMVNLVHEGRVQVMLKGFLSTGDLMGPVLDREKGLRTGKLLSDVMVVENPACESPELLGMSDGGLNILPHLDQKRQIIENAVGVFHRLGIDAPRVGIMAASEKVNDAMPATVHARQLTELNEKGDISGCRVYGPLALDIAVSQVAARHKGIDHPVAGQVQIMVVPNIEAGNLLGKAFTYYLKIPVAHVIAGARVPVLIPSRNETETDKINSVALGVICSGNDI